MEKGRNAFGSPFFLPLPKGDVAMLGISVYLGEPSFEKQEEYVEKMRRIGFSQIFTSLHIPEDDQAVYKERIQSLGKIAKKLGMELYADVSTKSLQRLGLSWDDADVLLDWGLTGLRIDYGIPEKTVAELSKKVKIALNASTLSQEQLELLDRYGMDVRSVEAWHNYYPRPETGLGREGFSEKNEWLKKQGLKVMAFVPGDGERRGPVYEGLPTLEDHRQQSPFVCFLDLRHHFGVDKVFIGDRSIGEHTYRQFEAYQNRLIILRAKYFLNDIDLKERFSVPQSNRPDEARDVVRSEQSRVEKLAGKPVRPENTTERPVGAITLDNERYGRYEGELQIAKRNLPADERVNVIGRVIDEDLPLLSYIRGGTKFQIIWV